MLKRIAEKQDVQYSGVAGWLGGLDPVDMSKNG